MAREIVCAECVTIFKTRLDHGYQRDSIHLTSIEKLKLWKEWIPEPATTNFKKTRGTKSHFVLKIFPSS